MSVSPRPVGIAASAVLCAPLPEAKSGQGSTVELVEWEAPGFKQDGYDFRALKVKP